MLETFIDKWAHSATDDCPIEAGNSTRNGKNACPDNDGDGWSNADDAFPDEVTQWRLSICRERLDIGPMVSTGPFT
jgi:hypothetical protein